MRKILLTLLCSAMAISPALAGTSTLSLPSGTGTARVGTDGSTNLFGNVGICDGAACANMAVVKAASTAAAATDPAFVVAISPNNSVAATLNATPTLANGNGVVPTQGGAVLSATNGIFSNLLQSNAVLSASNPLFSSVVQGGNTAVVKAANTVASTDVGLVVAVANTNANGSNTSANSSPVVIASDQAAVAVKGNAAVGSAPSNPVPMGAYAGGATGGLVAGLIQADSSAAISVSTATTTQIVALSSGRKIYVTAYDVMAAGTGNITFEYGTGTNCATGTTVLTGAYNLTAQAGISKGSGLGPVLVVPAGNALCVLTTAAVQMSGSVAYVQF